MSGQHLLLLESAGSQAYIFASAPRIAGSPGTR
jgi:hypothetical protein